MLFGLKYAHSLNVFHQDIKPENVFMQKNGRIKLGDFGIANVLASTDPNRKKKKVTGGTLPYASPEAFTGEEASYAGDIWAVGCMLREMITGEVAFLRNTR